MSLHARSDEMMLPADTVQVAQAAFPKGNPYLTLRDELGPLYMDHTFAALFAHRRFQFGDVGHHLVRRLRRVPGPLPAPTSRAEVDGRHAGGPGRGNVAVEPVADEDAVGRRQIEIAREEVRQTFPLQALPGAVPGAQQKAGRLAQFAQQPVDVGTQLKGVELPRHRLDPVADAGDRDRIAAQIGRAHV